MNDREKSKEIIQHYTNSQENVKICRITPEDEHRANELSREQIIEKYKQR